jgi:hypothetical protein
MLGKLSRWLRILGYDTAYDNQIDDSELLAAAKDQNRILLTRDRPLFERAKDITAVHVNEDNLDSQIAQLVEEVNLNLDRKTFTRCLHCNVLIDEVGPDEVSSVVPPFVLKSQIQFYRCPSCERVYWPGSHAEQMESRLTAIRETTRRISTL